MSGSTTSSGAFRSSCWFARLVTEMPGRWLPPPSYQKIGTLASLIGVPSVASPATADTAQSHLYGNRESIAASSAGDSATVSLLLRN